MTPDRPVGRDPRWTADIPASRLAPGDLVRVGAAGLRSRRLRTSLAALGVAIGIGAMIGVLGISASSRADLLAALDRLGTDLLTVQAGEGVGPGGDATLPPTAEDMIARIGPVRDVSSVTPVAATVLRTDLVPPTRTGGLTVQAADTELLRTLSGSTASGVWLDDVRAGLPVTVLGATAAERLGVRDVSTTPRVWLGGRWFTVVGVLDPLELAGDLDRSALIGRGVAADLFDTEPSPGTVYVRTGEESVDAVRAVLPRSADPENPAEVEVSRPSDALAARAASGEAFTGLFLGLGAVALLVGGVGVANVMVVSVLERRWEIGLRRSLGATRRHIAVQFLTEALVVSCIGGLGGVGIGVLVTAGYATWSGWDVVVPLEALVAALAATAVVGSVAGVYPAAQAARLAPTDALRSL